MKEHTFKTHAELGEDGLKGMDIARAFSKQFEEFGTAHDDEHPWNILETFDEMLAEFHLEVERGMFPVVMAGETVSYFRIVERTDDADEGSDSPTLKLV